MEFVEERFDELIITGDITDSGDFPARLAAATSFQPRIERISRISQDRCRQNQRGDLTAARCVL